ncbi:MAG: carboxypeptidase regulatory-like domain-containing protein, partial [Terriglobales bacterium]
MFAAIPLHGQEGTENTTAGTIQGTVLDEDGNPVEGARIRYISQSTDTRGTTNADKNGVYVSEQLPPSTYVVVAEGRDLAPAQQTVTVTAGAAASANFHLEWINPGPVRLQSQYTGDAPENVPINGRNYLTPGELFPGVQAVDGAVLDPGKSGFQTLGIDSNLGRTTRYDFDEIESMDETKGAAEYTLPAEAVREVVVSRVLPEVYQSLNAAGAVRVLTRTGGEEWHGNIFGDFRDQSLGLAGFPNNSRYSRQQYWFGAGGAVIKDKAFVFVGGERSKQDGSLPTNVGFPAPNGIATRDAYFRENMFLARLDYNVSENMKFFVRLGYDNANQVGPPNSFSSFRNQINVPSAAFGLDWNHGRFLHSARFGIQKLTNAVNPDIAASLTDPSAPFHIQLGSYSIGPSLVGPRQTLQRDLFGRYDSVTHFRVDHSIRFGVAVHRINQGDYFAPGGFGPSVTSSNGLATIGAIDGNPLLTGGAENILNYPVGTVTIYNGLGNFSETSAFNRSTGGHNDTRLEGYFGDRFNALPSLNIVFGLNYVYDTNRTDSDLSAVPCSAINTGIVTAAPCTGSNLILNQYGYLPPFSQNLYQPLGNRIHNPYNNFAPQLGLAWDPGHNGRTVVRLGAGFFYDNFLLQNTYQDRVNRLSNGQYNRSLTLCPAGSILFPDSAALGYGDIVSTAEGLDIATQICGKPLGAVETGSMGAVNVANAIQYLQQQFQANQATVSGGPNTYSLANGLADFGGMLAPTFRTPRVVHMLAGIERQMGVRSSFSIDYMRDVGTGFPLGIDSNHVGDATLLTDGVNPNPALNT